MYVFRKENQKPTLVSGEWISRYKSLKKYFKVEGRQFQSVVFGTLVPKDSPLAKSSRISLGNDRSHIQRFPSISENLRVY